MSIPPARGSHDEGTPCVAEVQGGSLSSIHGINDSHIFNVRSLTHLSTALSQGLILNIRHQVFNQLNDVTYGFLQNQMKLCQEGGRNKRQKAQKDLAGW